MTQLDAQDDSVHSAQADLRTAPVRCAHCTLAVPAGLVEPEHDKQFCCGACKLAHETINACNLDRYYELSKALASGPATPASSTGGSYAHFADATFEQMYVVDTPGGTRRVELIIDGMHCGACVWLLESLPRVVKGVLEARVIFGRSRIRLMWDASTTTLPDIARAVDRLGYRLRPVPTGDGDEHERKARLRVLVRLGVAGALAMNVMIHSVALYAGEAYGMSDAHHQLFRWLSVALSLIAISWPGATFFRGALVALRTRTPHTDVPISLGLAVGAAAGVWSAITGGTELYADSLVMLVFLLLVGRWFQAAQQRWAADAIELLHTVAPGVAKRVEDSGELCEVPTEALVAGDVIEVPAGDAFSADGIIEASLNNGQTTLDRSMLTGESVPVEVSAGEQVEAGVVNLSAPVRVRVTTTGAATRIGKLAELVQRASEERAPFVQAADRAAKRFVVSILLVATTTAIAWWFIEPSRIVGITAALLIVTCPCALALSTPLTVSVAIGKALRKGICVKGGETLERIAHARTIVLDKTGTLTHGSCELVDWVGDQSLKPLVQKIEQSSAHPVAKALVEQLPTAVGACEVADVQSTLGGGVRGVVMHEGKAVELIVGSERFVRDQCPQISINFAVVQAVDAAASRGLSPVLICAKSGRGHEVLAAALVGDSIRDGAPAFIRHLKKAGNRVVLLSGDRKDVSLAVAKHVGIAKEDVIAEASPERKAEVVAQLMDDAKQNHEQGGKRGGVVMVGDGVNDAAAMARASAGVAVHGGAEAALAAADVYLSKPGLSVLAELFDGCRRTEKLLLAGVLVSIAYNGICATIAILGLMHPLLAAVLMPCSSAAVTLLARYGTSFGGAARKE